MELFLEGIGLMAPGLAGWRESLCVLAGERPYRHAPMPTLAPGLLPPNERRRSTRVIKLALRVAEEALSGGARDPAGIRAVLVSSAGDGEIIDRICQALLLDGRPVSPTHFHNSVHNAPGGYWSIATACREPSTSISAHRHSFSAGLLEAAAQILVEKAPTLLVAYDHPPPFPLAPVCGYDEPFATAWLLAPTPSPRTLARLVLGVSATPVLEPLADPDLQALSMTSPAACALPLLCGIAAAEPRRVFLPYLWGQGLEVCIECSRGSGS